MPFILPVNLISGGWNKDQNAQQQNGDFNNSPKKSPNNNMELGLDDLNNGPQTQQQLAEQQQSQQQVDQSAFEEQLRVAM